MPAAAILVGGRARRLGGGTKPLLEIGGRTILARQLEALGQCGVTHVVLVGRWTADERPPAPLLADAVPDGGALGGLYTALLVAVAEPVLVLAGDMPFVTPALLDRFVSWTGKADAIVPYTGHGSHPLCAAYRRRVAGSLKARLDSGALSVREAVASLRVQPLDTAALDALDPDGGMLMNVNTPADYRRAGRLAAGDDPRT